MKSLKMLMMVVLTILTVQVFAQEKTGKKDTLKHVELYTCPMHRDVAKDKPGKCSKCGMNLTLSSKRKIKKEVVQAYSCPMKCEGDKTYAKPGKCPRCGMDLTEKKEDHSSHKH